MDEYISKEIAIERIKRVKPHVVMSEYGVGYERGLKDAIGILNATPAADVQPVKHGKWEETHISLVKYIPEDEKEEGHSFYMAELKCSCCERYNTVTFALTLNKPDFCQLCGARMDLKDGDEE